MDHPKWSENDEGCAKCGELLVAFINVTQKKNHSHLGNMMKGSPVGALQPNVHFLHKERRCRYLKYVAPNLYNSLLA